MRPIFSFLAVGGLVAVAFAAGADLKYTKHKVNRDARGKWDADTTYVHFNSSSAVTNLANREIKSQALMDIARFRTDAAKQMADSPDSMRPYAFIEQPTVTLARANLISGYFEINDFFGGAHGRETYRRFSFGLVNGKARRLKLADFFKKGVDARATLSALVIGKLKNRDGADWVKEGQVKELDATTCGSFVVTSTGFEYIFEPCVMGPYAAGSFDVAIPLSELKDKLDSAGPLKALGIRR